MGTGRDPKLLEEFLEFGFDEVEVMPGIRIVRIQLKGFLVTADRLLPKVGPYVEVLGLLSDPVESVSKIVPSGFSELSIRHIHDGGKPGRCLLEFS